MRNEGRTHRFTHLKRGWPNARPHPRDHVLRRDAQFSHRALQHAARKPTPARMCGSHRRPVARSKQHRHAVRHFHRANQPRRVAHHRVTLDFGRTERPVCGQRFGMMHIHAVHLVHPAEVCVRHTQRSSGEPFVLHDGLAVISGGVTQIKRVVRRNAHTTQTRRHCAVNTVWCGPRWTNQAHQQHLFNT